MKAGDLVKYNKPDSFIWQPPHDIPNGTIGLIVQELPDDEDDECVLGVLIGGRLRIIPKFFLRLSNEAR